MTFDSFPISGNQLRGAIEYIQENLRESLDPGSVAQGAGLSAFHFARLFKEATDVSLGLGAAWPTTPCCRRFPL